MPGEINNDDPINKPAATPEEIKAQVEAMVAEQLKDIKAKLDQAYSARDEAARKAVAFEEAEKKAKMEALAKEGKHAEVANMKVLELTEKLTIAERRNTELARDSVVRESLTGLKFRNDRSREMAYRDVLDQLVQDTDSGTWVHKTGVSVKDFISQFAKDESNSFLFEVKANTGAGGGNNAGGAPNITSGKDILKMTTTEILALANAGKLGQFQT